MKICLINPPDLHSLDPKLDAPLGLMYLSSTLQDVGHECQILDLALYNKIDWKPLIESIDADLFGLTVYSASVLESDIINKLIKTYHPESKIIWGGPHPTYEWISAFVDFPEIDFIAMGEGEGIMLDLCANFGNTYKYDGINGLINRKERGFYASGPRGLIKNLDDLPFPDRYSINLREYTRRVEGKLSTPIITGRGCAYDCKICLSHEFWKHPRFHSLSRIIAEFATIKEMGFDAFHCWDDTFTLNPNMKKILKIVKGLDFVFRCNGNLRTDTKETLQLLKDSGCKEYCVGIESGDQRILDIMHKGTTIERNKQVLQWAKEVGLPVKAFLMVGNAGESWESVKNTIKFVQETNPEYYTLFNFTPLPGTPIYKNPETYKIKIRNRNWTEYYNIGGQNVGGCVIDTEFMTAEEIGKARQMILDELPKQKGKLQEYYKELK